MRSERRICFVMGSPRLPHGRRGKSRFEQSSGSLWKKRRMPSAIERRECDYWMGTETGMLRGYGFSVPSNGRWRFKQTLGAGYNNLRRKKEKQQYKVGWEEESSSSNQTELAAFLPVLRDTLIEGQMLYLCDNQSLLKAVNRSIDDGWKTMLVGAPDSDVLAEANEIMQKRIAAGTATFLVKAKASSRTSKWRRRRYGG